MTCVEKGYYGSMMLVLAGQTKLDETLDDAPV
jgi:hypothetical protein